MPKKIIFTATSDLRYDRRMQRICTALTASGYHITLAGRQLSSSPALSPQPFEQKIIHTYIKKGKFFYMTYNIRLFWYLLFVKADAFCAIDLDTVLPVYWVGKLRRKTVIYDAHEYFTEVPEVVHRPIIKKIWEKIANIALPNIQHNYTVGNELARIFTARYGQTYAIVRNVPPLLPPAISIEKKMDKTILLYQGALNEGRGIIEILNVMPLLPKCELWLVGEGDLSKLLRQKVKELGIEQQVKFWGYILPSELATITAQADIGLNLLENKGLNYYYSLANKFFDFAQAEKPSINMDFPEYRSLFKQFPTGKLIPDLNPQTLIRAIHSLKKKENYAAAVQACIAAKQHWNWQTEQQILVNFYRQVLPL